MLKESYLGEIYSITWLKLTFEERKYFKKYLGVLNDSFDGLDVKMMPRRPAG